MWLYAVCTCYASMGSPIRWDLSPKSYGIRGEFLTVELKIWPVGTVLSGLASHILVSFDFLQGKIIWFDLTGFIGKFWNDMMSSVKISWSLKSMGVLGLLGCWVPKFQGSHKDRLNSATICRKRSYIAEDTGTVF